jgi:hypothetical protein
MDEKNFREGLDFGRTLIEAVDQLVDDRNKGKVTNAEFEKYKKESCNNTEFMNRKWMMRDIESLIREFRDIKIVDGKCNKWKEGCIIGCAYHHGHGYGCELHLPCGDDGYHGVLKGDPSYFNHMVSEIVSYHEKRLEMIKSGSDRHVLTCACGKTTTSTKNPAGKPGYSLWEPNDAETILSIEKETGWRHVQGKLGYGMYSCPACHETLKSCLSKLATSGLMTIDTDTGKLLEKS